MIQFYYGVAVDNNLKTQTSNINKTIKWLKVRTEAFRSDFSTRTAASIDSKKKLYNRTNKI